MPEKGQATNGGGASFFGRMTQWPRVGDAYRGENLDAVGGEPKLRRKWADVVSPHLPWQYPLGLSRAPDVQEPLGGGQERKHDEQV